MELLIIVGLIVVGLAFEWIFPPTEKEREVMRKVQEERDRRLVEEWKRRCEETTLSYHALEPTVYCSPPDVPIGLEQPNRDRRNHRHARQARVEKNPKTPAAPTRSPAGK